MDSEVRTTVSLGQSHYYHLLFLSLPFFLSHTQICLFPGVWFQHSTQAKQECGALITTSPSVPISITLVALLIWINKKNGASAAFQCKPETRSIWILKPFLNSSLLILQHLLLFLPQQTKKYSLQVTWLHCWWFWGHGRLENLSSDLSDHLKQALSRSKGKPIHSTCLKAFTGSAGT